MLNFRWLGRVRPMGGIAAEDPRFAADEMAESGIESLRFLNREVNELLSDLDG